MVRLVPASLSIGPPVRDGIGEARRKFSHGRRMKPVDTANRSIYCTNQ